MFSFRRMPYIILLVATLSAVLLYLERVCLSIAATYIREDLLLTETQVSLVLALFFWAYALGQVPSGWLTDKFGPRRMMTLYLVAWSVFGIGIALANSYFTLLLSRFLLGLSQAGAYPTLAVLMKQWIPESWRGLANGIVSFGGRLGGAMANLLTAVLMLAFVPVTTPAEMKPSDILDFTLLRKQWESKEESNLTPLLEHLRSSFTVGPEDSATIVRSLNSWQLPESLLNEETRKALRFSSDGNSILAVAADNRSPQQQSRLRRLVLEKLFPGSIKQLHGLGWRPALLVFGGAGVVMGILFWMVVRDKPFDASQSFASKADYRFVLSKDVSLFALAQFCFNFGWAFIVTLMSQYLAEVYSVSLEDRGLMTMVPLLASGMAMITGGWLTDFLSRRLGKPLGITIPAGWLKALCVLAMLACPYLTSAWHITIAFTIMAVVVDLGMPAIWSFAQQVGKDRTGFLLGYGNMWGNFGAGICPVLLAAIKPYWGWNGGFYLLAGAFFISMIAGSLMKPRN